MEKKQKRNPMEVLWLCMAVMCLIIAVIRTVKFCFEEGTAMYIGSALCVLMFLWRRNIRKNEENRL